MVSQNQKRPIWWGGTIFLNQLRKICMTNHKQHVKLIWCEKNGIVFQAFKRDLPKAMKVGTVSFAAF